MRFPAVMYTTMIKYLLQQKLKGTKRYPMVLMLEPTLRCNLDCVGCGRIEQYHRERMPDLTLEQCLESVDECGAPIVSVCGGEPLVYKPVDKLIEALIDRKKYIYLCTNAMFLDKWWDRIPPNKRLSLSIHLDGMEEGHDWAVDQKGVFQKVSAIIDEAKARGYRISTNTTVFDGTNPSEIREMMDYLTKKGVDGMLISGAYPQEGEKGETGLDREKMEEVFREIFGVNGSDVSHKYRLNNTPAYMDFLRGMKDITCSPWASPNRTCNGWKAPCYVLNDGYYQSFAELMKKTDWESLGPGKDKRCENCKIHSGFEPTVALGRDMTLKDHLKMIKWNLLSA